MARPCPPGLGSIPRVVGLDRRSQSRAFSEATHLLERGHFPSASRFERQKPVRWRGLLCDGAGPRQKDRFADFSHRSGPTRRMDRAAKARVSHRVLERRCRRVDRGGRAPGQRAHTQVWSRPSASGQFADIARDLVERGVGERLLDVGTGPGRLLAELRKLDPEVELTVRPGERTARDTGLPRSFRLSFTSRLQPASHA